MVRATAVLLLPTCLATPACDTAGEASATAQTPLFEHVDAGRISGDGGASRGVAWGDFDGDGDPDLAVSNADDQWNALYRNDGVSDEASSPAHLFTKLTDRNRSSWALFAAAGERAEGVSWIDYDADGDLDLFVVTRGPQPNLLFRNDGAGLTQIHDGPLTEAALGASMACWADVDGDGWLDVFLAGYGGDPNRIFRNELGRFVELDDHPLAYTGTARTCAWGDPDDDGRPDLYVGNASQPNDLFRNRGGWAFERQAEGHLATDVGYSYGLSWADYDGDGDQDLFVANFDTFNRLYANDGTGTLTPVLEGTIPEEPGGASKGHAWADYDLDGILDLFVANGTYGPDMRNFVYRGTGSGHFERDMIGDFAAHADTSAGAAWADYDLDGDLDVFVANWGSSDQVNRLYRNTTSEATGGSWIRVRLRSDGPNTAGWGAKVVAVADPGSGRTRMTRWHDPVTGYASQNEPVVHFGLGTAERIDSLIVRWPSGAVDVHTQLDARAEWQVTEGGERERLR